MEVQRENRDLGIMIDSKDWLIMFDTKKSENKDRHTSSELLGGIVRQRRLACGGR